MKTTILWFRKDLRLTDNQALFEASKRGNVVTVFIWAPEEEGQWAPGKTARNWLHHSLYALEKSLQEERHVLIFKKGPSLATLRELCFVCRADAVYWNRCYEPKILERDAKVMQGLKAQGIDVSTFNSALLMEPWDITTKEGKPFKMFTPFWKTLVKHAPFLPEKKVLFHSSKVLPKSLHLNDLNLLNGKLEDWAVGEKEAIKKLKIFVKKIQEYATQHNRCDLQSTSRISPHLHFGEISPRQIWKETALSSDFQRQLIWREFAYHLLYNFPKSPETSLKSLFEKFPWNEDEKMLRAWQQGKTGYPFIDAGMRQLLKTGWMHNRVRLVAASFLTKDLLIPWQVGARWFWENLLDADLANNTLGWQWTAGCGADAAPYFRIFNPTLQGKKFDPEGKYIKKYIPELAHFDTEWIHTPWLAPLKKKYPLPIIDHEWARRRALKIFNKLKNTSTSH